MALPYLLALLRHVCDGSKANLKAVACPNSRRDLDHPTFNNGSLSLIPNLSPIPNMNLNLTQERAVGLCTATTRGWAELGELLERSRLWVCPNPNHSPKHNHNHTPNPVPKLEAVCGYRLGTNCNGLPGYPTTLP